MGERVWIGVLAAVSLASTGCMDDGLEEAPWVAALESESVLLDAALDNVEARLHSGRTRVALWEELAARHRSVSEIACANAEMHMKSISKHFAKTEEVMKKKRRRRAARVEASAPPGNSTEGVGGPPE